MSVPLQIAILALLILLNGVFALSELALVSSKRAMLTLMERKGVRGAAKARALADNPQAFLPASQFGITLVGILTGVFGGDELSQHLIGPALHMGVPHRYVAPLALGLTVIVITFFTLVFGELVPKQLALRHPERLATFVAGPLAVVGRVTAPIVVLLGAATHIVLKLFGPAGDDRRGVSEEELKAMVVEGAETGVLEHEERDIIERVLRLADKPVRAIMTPRTEIVWIDRLAPRQSILAALREAPHSRLVVCDGAVDNVAGIVHAKDILDRLLEGKEVSLGAALRQPTALPDSASALEALERLKGDALGIALVLDEYGSFEGIVTAADVLESMVGDAEDAAPREGDQDQGGDSFELDGLTPVDEIKARLHLPDLPNEGSYHTVGGLILALLQRPPRIGDTIVFGGWRFGVLAMDGRRVERVRLEREG